MTPWDKSLANPKTVAEMTAAYNSADIKIKQAYQLLEDAKNELNNGFGSRNDYMSSFDTIDRYHISNSAEENYNHIHKQIKKSAWKYIINLLGIKKLLSISRANEFDEKLEDPDKMPEITDSNIFDMMEALRQQTSGYMKEAVLEVFDFLRVGKEENNHLKTNKKNARFDLGQKIILPYFLEPKWRGGMEVKYGTYTNELTALDKVFSMLDGKTMEENYKSPLIDTINTSPNGTGETEYFSFKACKNGNLHIEFKRMDLVTMMNQLAGNPSQLKSKETKTARKWANPFTILRLTKDELGVELYSIKYHQEFWPDNDQKYHSFLVCGFLKNKRNNVLIFFTGKVNKQGQVSDLFELDRKEHIGDIWKGDLEKYWEEELEAFIVE